VVLLSTPDHQVFIMDSITTLTTSEYPASLIPYAPQPYACPRMRM
jgi:hypothetical protein